ncbi:DUF6913 domain-containing protein [Bacteroidota bacterium]
MKQWFLNISIVGRISLAVGRYFLKKDMRVRNRKIQSIALEDARSIGILFNAKDEKTFKEIRDFAEEMRGGGVRKVKALGFVPKSDVAAFLESSKDFDFFSPQDFNWYQKPQGRKVAGFISEEFDILFDLRLKRSVSLLFIVGLSRAYFKVGKFEEKYKEYYDLMIDVADSAELPYFISQVKYYLSKINERK